MSARSLAVVLIAALSGVLLLVTATSALLGVAGRGPCGPSPSRGAAVWPTPASTDAGPRTGQVTAPITPDPSGASDMAGPVTGCQDGERVLTRAASWLTAWAGGAVPYASSTDPSTWFGGYRRDCSGFASMALGLPGPGLDTAALAARSRPITKVELVAGDLLINAEPGPAGHVVVFDHWTGPGMDSYWAYEQSGDGGTHHRVVPFPYFGSYPMSPFRPAATALTGAMPTIDGVALTTVALR